jgi:hypothetical protein
MWRCTFATVRGTPHFIDITAPAKETRRPPKPEKRKRICPLPNFGATPNTFGRAIRAAGRHEARRQAVGLSSGEGPIHMRRGGLRGLLTVTDHRATLAARMNSCAASPVDSSESLATARGPGAVTLTIYRQSEIAPANVRQPPHTISKDDQSDQTTRNPHRGDRGSRGGRSGSRARAHVELPRHRRQTHPCGPHHHHHDPASEDPADCRASAGDNDSTRDTSADHDATPAAEIDPAADCRAATAADNGPAADHSAYCGAADYRAAPAADNGPSGGYTSGR